MKPLLLLISLSLINLTPLSVAADSIPERTWTSATDSKVKATGIGISGKKIILEKTDGKILKVEIRKLSEADQKLIRLHFAEELGVDSEAKSDKEETPALKIRKGDKLQKDDDGNYIVLPYDLGSTNEIEINRAHKMTVYVPSSLRGGEKHAVLIIADPYGGSTGQVGKYINAADQNEFIIVGVPKIDTGGRDRNNNRNNYGGYVNEINIKPLFNDVLRQLHKDFSIDTKRIYFAGEGKAAMCAMWAMSTYRAAGVIVMNGAGQSTYKASNRNAFVGLCPTRGKARWDVCSTFSECKGSSISRLLFYDGSGAPSQNDISDAMLQLNAMFLLKHAAGTHEKAALRHQIELIQEVVNNTDTDEIFAWIHFVERYGFPTEKFNKELEELKKEALANKIIAKFEDGEKEVTKIALRYFAKGYKDHEENNGRKSTVNAITKVKEKYAGSYWENILAGLAEAAR